MSTRNDQSAPELPDYLLNPDAVIGDASSDWRYGRAPDYSKTRKIYEETKSQNHAAGSLPSLVENLVKNWEVEASFKKSLQDWRTVDHANYTFAINGGPPQSAEHMLKVGTYNAIIAPNEYYSPERSDFAHSHKVFKRMMPTFAWEVIEVYSGPPVVAFKWRHWGVMRSDYVGLNNKGEKIRVKAHGGDIDVKGVTVAKVDDKVRLQSVETWFDPMEMFRQIVAGRIEEVICTAISSEEPENSDSDSSSQHHTGAKLETDIQGPAINQMNGLNGGDLIATSPEISHEVKGTDNHVESDNQGKLPTPTAGCPFMR